MKKRILAFHDSHNASVCEIMDGKIVYSQEAERLDKIKRSTSLPVLLEKYKNQKADKVIFVCHHTDIDTAKQLWPHQIECDDVEYISEHHFFHGCSSYFNSGFDKSYVLVMDGSGKNENDEKEIVSLYYFSKNRYKTIFKVFASANERQEGKCFYINTLSLGHLFKVTASILGMKEAGSVMGYSCYQKPFEYSIFGEQFNHFKFDQYFLKNIIENRDNKAKQREFCFMVQKNVEDIVIRYVKNIVKNKKRNLCVSGGVFQNSVLNGKLLDHCDNLFVDPISHDGGLSVGAALWHLNKNQFQKTKYNDLFLGDSLDYSKLKNYRKTNTKEIATILSAGKIVAIAQGRNEIGPRALGNRSILFDPRDPNAKEKINLLKQREWFRPYAGTVLHEYANEWFDLKNKKETPYMSYCFKVKRHEIPGITHIDGSCRVQTLKKEQNIKFYDLITEFYNITKVPILFNTSFNEAGMPLLNTIEDIVDFFNKNTYLDVVYFPDIQVLISRKNLL
jgi:carbamoyltransferase